MKYWVEYLKRDPEAYNSFQENLTELKVTLVNALISCNDMHKIKETQGQIITLNRLLLFLNNEQLKDTYNDRPN